MMMTTGVAQLQSLRLLRARTTISHKLPLVDAAPFNFQTQHQVDREVASARTLSTPPASTVASVHVP